MSSSCLERECLNQVGNTLNTLCGSVSELGGLHVLLVPGVGVP